MEFAVWHEGIEEGQARWVLMVDPAGGGRVLLAGQDGSLYWRALADCKLLRASSPDQARPVVVLQPQKQVIVPDLLRGNGHR